MGVMDWLSGRAERVNVSYARNYLNKLRREVADTPELLPQLATWIDQDEVVDAVMSRALLLPPIERRSEIAAAAHSMMKMGQRLDRDLRDSGGLSVAAGRAALLLSHLLYLRSVDDSDELDVRREVRLVYEEYEQFFNRLEPYFSKPQQSDKRAETNAIEQPPEPPTDPYAEVRKRIEKIGSHLKPDGGS